MTSITIDLPESVPAAEARLELALALLKVGRITQGEAARLAGFSRLAFIELLASRGLPFTNIDQADLEQELATWRSLASRTAN